MFYIALHTMVNIRDCCSKRNQYRYSGNTGRTLLATARAEGIATLGTLIRRAHCTMALQLGSSVPGNS